MGQKYNEIETNIIHNAFNLECFFGKTNVLTISIQPVFKQL